MALIRRGIHFDTHGVDDGTAMFGRLAEAARAAEDAGFDAISVPDHLYDPGGPASPMFEAYTVLGALAAVTSSATLLTLASPVTLRAPGLLAKAVTTLDVVSGGRAVLGVGVGWDVAEHEAYGIEFPGLGERFERLEEELAICHALFRNEQATFTGKFYAVRDACSSPRPVRGFIPVLVAGNGEKRTRWTLPRATGTHAMCTATRRMSGASSTRSTGTASGPGETRQRSPGPQSSSTPGTSVRWPRQRGRWRQPGRAA